MEMNQNAVIRNRPGRASSPLRALAAWLLLVLAAPAAFAQSCAMCYDSAKQQGPEAARALNTGIVVLLLPSLLLFGGVVVTAFRRRETTDIEQ